MKVDLTAAIEELKSANIVNKDEYLIARVSYHTNLSIKEGLGWELYAYSTDGKQSAWNGTGKTFDDALASLQKKLKPSNHFIVEE